MYYQEAVINGVLSCRYSPDGKWKPFTQQKLTARIQEMQAMIIVMAQDNAKLDKLRKILCTQ